VWEWEEGITFTRDLEERRELPQRGPGQSPGEKQIWCILSITELRINRDL